MVRRAHRIDCRFFLVVQENQSVESFSQLAFVNKLMYSQLMTWLGYTCKIGDRVRLGGVYLLLLQYLWDKIDTRTDNTTRQKLEPHQRKYNKATVHHIMSYSRAYMPTHQSTKSHRSRVISKIWAQSTNTVGVAGVSYELLFRLTVADPELWQTITLPWLVPSTIPCPEAGNHLTQLTIAIGCSGLAMYTDLTICV